MKKTWIKYIQPKEQEEQEQENISPSGMNETCIKYIQHKKRFKMFKSFRTKPKNKNYDYP